METYFEIGTRVLFAPGPRLPDGSQNPEYTGTVIGLNGEMVLVRWDAGANREPRFGVHFRSLQLLP
jgi:hypothetical protein